MKINDLIDYMQNLKVKLPPTSTGSNGRILARDLEFALGNHFKETKYEDNPMKQKHLAMRRSLIPMKAFRYDKLKTFEQTEVFEDEENWFAEEKYNGWRIMITYIPGDGFCFWGGNVSDVDFLPNDYTNHVSLGGLHPRANEFKSLFGAPFILDTEALCHHSVEMKDGLFSNNTLDAVGAILGSSPTRACHMQTTATLEFMCFDCLLLDEFGNPETKQPLHARKFTLSALMSRLIKCAPGNFHFVPSVYKNKKRLLNDIWKCGNEGIILKDKHQPYVSGGRSRNTAIKVKRTMSGEIGDDLDCFISGWQPTKEWDKKNLIGALELSVWLREGDEVGDFKEHHIATVSAMPDSVREVLTTSLNNGSYFLNKKYIGKVVVVDGQELSNKNRKLMHAKIDWDRGFRVDKLASDCVLEVEILEKEMF